MILLYVYLQYGSVFATLRPLGNSSPFLHLWHSYIQDTVEKSQQNRFGALTSLLGRSAMHLKYFPAEIHNSEPGTSETNVHCSQQWL